MATLSCKSLSPLVRMYFVVRMRSKQGDDIHGRVRDVWSYNPLIICIHRLDDAEKESHI